MSTPIKRTLYLFLLNNYHSYLGINLSPGVLFCLHTEILLRCERRNICAGKKVHEAGRHSNWLRCPGFLTLVKALFPFQIHLYFFFAWFQFSNFLAICAYLTSILVLGVHVLVSVPRRVLEVCAISVLSINYYHILYM